MEITSGRPLRLTSLLSQRRDFGSENLRFQISKKNEKIKMGPEKKTFGGLKVFCCASETNLTTLYGFCRVPVVFAGTVPGMSEWHEDHPWPSLVWYFKCQSPWDRPHGHRRSPESPTRPQASKGEKDHQLSSKSVPKSVLDLHGSSLQ